MKMQTMGQRIFMLLLICYLFICFSTPSLAMEEENLAPRYMNQRLYRYQPNTKIANIIGRNDNFVIDGKLYNKPDYTLQHISLEQEEVYVLDEIDEQLMRVLVIRKGSLALRTGDFKEQLKRFDLMLLGNDSIEINGVERKNNFFVMIYRKIDNVEAKKIAFLEQEPLRKKGVQKILDDLKLSSFKKVANKFLSVLSPEDLYMIVGKSEKDFYPKFAMERDDNVEICLAKTPIGTGPSMHIHKGADEIFIVLRGVFLIKYGDYGEYEVTLSSGDVIALPPSINRTFVNVGKDHGVIMPVVLGASGFSDLIFLPVVKKELKDKRIGVFPLGVAIKIFDLKFKKREQIRFPYEDCSQEI